MYVVVTGPPASGETALPSMLAERLELPLLVKDDVKRGLVRARAADNVEESRQRGREAGDLLLRMAADRARERSSGLGDIVEVFCRCDLDTTRRRHRRGRAVATRGEPAGRLLVHPAIVVRRVAAGVAQKRATVPGWTTSEPTGGSTDRRGQTKALLPVMARPTIRVLISLVPS